MQYASRDIQLSQISLGIDLEKGFIQHIELAHSNIPENRDGALIYDKYVRPAKVDLIRVGAHYAVTNLFQPEMANEHIYAFTIDRQGWQLFNTGSSRLALGRARVISDVTYEWADVTFSVLHLGDHNLTAGVRGRISDDRFKDFTAKVVEAFEKADLPQVIRNLDKEFFGLTYSLRALFKDERQVIIQQILRSNLDQAEAALRSVFDNNASLMRFLATIGSPQPDILQAAGRFVVSAEMRRQLEDNVPDPQRLLQLVDDATAWNLSLQGQGLELSLNTAIERQTLNLWSEIEEEHAMKALVAMSTLAMHLPFVNFWQAQNVIFRLMDTRYSRKKELAQQGNVDAAEWVDLYRHLGEQLKVKIDE
jgi:hypothetical protein